jgi:hypothetical protein
MAGLVPAIHDLLVLGKDVDARVKPAHDAVGSGMLPQPGTRRTCKKRN